MYAIAVVALLAFLGPLAGCTRSDERYQLIANSPQVQTWFDSKTGVSISCPLMSSDQGCQLYESFEKRTEAIRKNDLKEAEDREVREKADALAARDLQIEDIVETCNLAGRGQ